MALSDRGRNILVVGGIIAAIYAGTSLLNKSVERDAKMYLEKELARVGDDTVIGGAEDFISHIVFPAIYPAPVYEDKSREHNGRLIRVASWDTTNEVNGVVKFNGPGLKKFLLLASECPTDLGCSFDSEVADLIAGQESKGARIVRNNTVPVGASKVVDLSFMREVNGVTYYFRNLLIPYEGYVVSASVQVTNPNDLDSIIVNDFFASIDLVI